MHQYLLLRDNKKSGPYSAEDLRQLGLKSYDLIWQEGKSAAWRYPGELDELKAFAPPVEEQPYDRFYRKPEKPAPATPPPTPAPEPVREFHKGHIVVTMPASVAARKKEPEKAPEEPVYKRQTYYTPEPPIPPAVQTRTVSPTELPAEPVMAAASAPAFPAARKKSPFFALVISIFLIATLAILYLNYTIQNNKIKQLRDIVTQMQQNQVTPSDPNRQLVHYRLDPEPENIKATDSGLALSATAATEKKLPKKNTGSIEAKRKSIISPVTDSAMVAATPPAPPAESGQEKRVSVKRDDEANLRELVSIKTNDYKNGLLGGINNLKVTLYNKSLSVLKKVDVQIDYLGPESRVVKTQHVYFENVAPGEDLMLDVPKSNRGVKVNCTVKKIST